MSTALRWTSADLLALPDDGKRYEIIDGEFIGHGSPTGIISAHVGSSLPPWMPGGDTPAWERQTLPQA